MYTQRKHHKIIYIPDSQKKFFTTKTNTPSHFENPDDLDQTTSTTTASNTQASLDGQPSTTSDSSATPARDDDASVRDAPLEPPAVEQPNDIHTQQDTVTSESDQLINEKELLEQESLVRSEMASIEAFDLKKCAKSGAKKLATIFPGLCFW